MSGVISADGTQWERCNDDRCGHKWVRLDDLYYEPPSAKYKHGRDLCRGCKSRSVNVDIALIASAYNGRGC